MKPIENPIKKDEILDIYTDGASRGNPGPAAWAYIFVKDRNMIHENSGYIGRGTNNTAEYLAIINALREAEKYTRWEVRIFSDSELVIRQIKKDYRIKKQHLSQLCSEVYSLIQKFDKVEFFAVGRENEFLRQTDEICNDCVDMHYGKSPRRESHEEQR